MPSDKKPSLVTKKVYKLKLLFHFPTIICQGWGVGTGSKIGFWHFYAPAPFFTLALYLFARCQYVKVLLRLLVKDSISKIVHLIIICAMALLRLTIKKLETCILSENLENLKLHENCFVPLVSQASLALCMTLHYVSYLS